MTRPGLAGAALIAAAVAISSYAGAELIRSIFALAIVYCVGYVTGSLLVHPTHSRASLSVGVVRLIAGCLLTAIAFLLSLRLSLPWFSGPIGLLALAVIYHRREAFVPPDVRVTLSWDGLVAGLVSVVLLAPPVLAALRMAPGEFPPVFFNVDVPYFLEQVHALVGADRFPPDSLGVVDGRRAYHFGVPALAALIARGSGAEPHHVLFVILVPTFAAGILAAAVVLARAIGPTVPSSVAVPLLLVPSPGLWYEFSQALVRTLWRVWSEQSLEALDSLSTSWEMWGVTPNVQNFAAQFILLAGLGAVANAPAMGWRLPSFFLGSAIIFKAPVGIALVAGFSFAQACRAAMARSLRPLIPIASVAAVFGVVYATFWIVSPVRAELRAVVSPLFQLGHASAHGGVSWFVFDVAWLLLPALVVVLAGRKDPEKRSLPLLAFAAGPFIVVNLLRLDDLRRDFGINSMTEDDWRQVILPVPFLIHAFVLSVVGRRWVHLGAGFRSAVVFVVLIAVIAPGAVAARYAGVLLKQPDRGHEFADNRALGAALAVIPTKDSLVVTNDLRYPADEFRRQDLQLQIPSLFGHQAFAVNYMYEAYSFSEDRRKLQGLLEAAYWTPAIDEAARTHGWTHLVIRNDSPHPQPIPLDRVFDSPLYSVFRFTTTQSSPAAVGSRHDRAGSLDEDAIMPDRQLLRDETSHARAAHPPRRAQGAGAGSRIDRPRANPRPGG